MWRCKIMGLDQWILRGNNDDTEPYIEDGDWVNCKEILQLRKEYWLHNRILKIGEQKLNKPYEELNCVFIPLTKEELTNILNDSKECVQAKSEYLISDYFETGIFYSNYDLEWCLEGMKRFNKTIGSSLRSKNEDYYYWSWW